MRDAQIDATSVGKAKAFEGEICNACTEMKQKHHIGAVGIATLKAVNCDIFSWSSRVGPTPAPFVTMILEQPDMRAASQMEAKGDTSANGRERKHCQTALEHIALSKKPTGF